VTARQSMQQRAAWTREGCARHAAWQCECLQIDQLWFGACLWSKFRAGPAECSTCGCGAVSQCCSLSSDQSLPDNHGVVVRSARSCARRCGGRLLAVASLDSRPRLPRSNHANGWQGACAHEYAIVLQFSLFLSLYLSRYLYFLSHFNASLFPLDVCCRP
jgi:hypothetical protein